MQLPMRTLVLSVQSLRSFSLWLWRTLYRLISWLSCRPHQAGRLQFWKGFERGSNAITV